MTALLALWKYRNIASHIVYFSIICILCANIAFISAEKRELEAKIIAENIRVEMMRHESERLAARFLIQSQRSDRAQVNITRNVRNAEDDKIAPALAAALDGLRSYGAEVSTDKP